MPNLRDALVQGGFVNPGPKLFELKKQRAHALNQAESIAGKAEKEGRELTDAEQSDFDSFMTCAQSLTPKIQAKESLSTVHVTNNSGVLVDGKRAYLSEPKRMLNAGYADAFVDWLRSGGTRIDAALYEGGDAQGGFVVPSVVDQMIVPLAPSESAVRRLAMVIPTSMDIKIPRKSTFGAVAIKAESGASANTFTESDPMLDQTALSAYMVGGTHTVSWELLQDVQTFQQFSVDDLLLAMGMYEEGKFISGSGTGEPQGLIGNTGTGVTGVAAGSDSYGSELLTATFDVQAKLNAMYHSGASWLMSRDTCVALRKAQSSANLFYQIFTRDASGQDRLHGYPIEYSSSMPSIASGHTPILFGDFKRGYVIGDRGGSGINVKILDQPLATQGQTILLAYRRVDARIRRSEAIQAITLA